MQQHMDISDDVLIALRKIIQAIDLNSKRLVSMMDAKGIIAAPFLSAAPIGVVDNPASETEGAKN